jgi:hypothetical protein
MGSGSLTRNNHSCASSRVGKDDRAYLYHTKCLVPAVMHVLLGFIVRWTSPWQPWLFRVVSLD